MPQDPAEEAPSADRWTREVIHVDDILARLDDSRSTVTWNRAEWSEVPGDPAPEPVDPGERWWVGRFFPNDCTASWQRFPWHREGDPFIMRVRHLPGRRTLAMTLDRLGDRALPVLLAWQALWATCLDPHETDTRRKVEQAGDECAAELADRIAGHDALRDGLHREATARALRSPGASPRLDQAVRDPAFHVMEDASVHLALVASGMPFVLDLPMPKGVSWRFVPTPGGGLRRIMPESEDYRRASASLAEAWAGAQPYWRSHAFRDRAGRDMAVADGVDDLLMILVDMAAQGRRKAFLKSCLSKGGTWTVDLSDLKGSHDALGRVARALGPSVSMIYGGVGERTMLVQDHVPFVAEHRFLVVGHRVVASTASVRSLSVVDGTPARIVHPFVAALAKPAGEPGPYDRGESVPVPDRGLAARMAWCARDLARALSREEGTPDLYCIDVGQDRDGRVLPIELNGLSSSGLYALTWRRVADALLRRHARREAPGRSALRASSTTLTVKAFVSGVRASPNDMLGEAANHFVRWAMTLPSAPGTFGYLDAHRDEIRAYVESEFKPPTAKALRLSVGRFDPLLHQAWVDRYADWLGRLGLDRAAAALPEIEALAGEDALTAWAFHPSDPPGGWMSAPRKVTLSRPGPDHDVTGVDEDEGIVTTVSFPGTAIDLGATLNRRVCFEEPDRAVLVLRRGARISILEARDHGTGDRLTPGTGPHEACVG